MIWLLSVVLSLLPASHASLRMSKVGSCNAPKGSKTVLIIKQWHLAPTTVTKGFREKYPQEKNQTAIYKALAGEIKKRRIQLVVAEGCEGEINDEFTTAFNGWDLATLKKQSQTKAYPKVLSHVPLKLEARFGPKVLTLCGDNEKLIQEGNLRLSNLRGWMGFWTRLAESKTDPERLKLYSGSAADLLGVPKDTPVDKLLALVRENVKADLEAFNKSLQQRNDGFVKVASSQEYKKAAIVIGGLHAQDLKEKIQAAGLGCEVLEPPGYARSSEKLIEEFQRALD